MADNDFNPADEAAKDTVYIALQRRADQSLIEYEDILAYAKTLEYYNYPDLEWAYALVNDALRLSIKAANAAHNRFIIVYATLGGN